MTRWTTDELNTIGNAEELHIASYGRDGMLRHPVPIWSVRIGNDLYVRSWRGLGGRWYRAHGRHTRATSVPAVSIRS
jgi:hypothetical protein